MFISTSDLILILSEESKVKYIQCNLGHRYSRTQGRVSFHLDTLPPHLKTKGDVLFHKVFGSLDQSSSVSMPSAHPLEEGTNLFEAAQSVAAQAQFVSCQEARDLAEKISAKLGIIVSVKREPNREPERKRLEAENQRMGVLAGKKIAQALANGIAQALGLPEKEELIPPLPLETAVAASSVQEPVEPVELTEDEQFIVESIDIRTIEVFREVIALLAEEGYLSSEEKEALPQTSLMAKLDERIAFQRAFSYKLSSDQRDCLSKLFQPHIEAIIERCAQMKSTEELLGGAAKWASFKGELNPRTIAFTSLISSADSHVATFLGEQFGGLRELRSDAEILNSVYAGNGCHEKTLEEKNLDIPSLEKQRLVLFELFEEMLFKKFGAENFSDLPLGLDPFLVKEVRKQLFIAGHSLKVLTGGKSMTMTPFKTAILAIQRDYSSWQYRFSEEENARIRASVQAAVATAREKCRSSESRAASSV